MAETTTRTEKLLKSRELIREYIEANLEQLMKLKDGSIIIQVICLDLNLTDNQLMCELAGSVWQEIARNELGRLNAKQDLKKDLAVKPPGPSQKPLQEPAVDPRTAGVIQQVEKERLATLEVFSDALAYLTLELERSKMGILERAVRFLRTKMGAKTGS